MPSGSSRTPLSTWVEGMRPRTFPNAIAPVLAGSCVALVDGQIRWWAIALASAVSLLLIIGVNFANDYSDGVRGTDDHRSGPLRLTASGAASQGAVKAAAIIALVSAGICGAVLSVLTEPWLLVLGAICIAAAWLYTGGKKPYGYRGYGEASVFVFFGLVAVCGTEFVNSGVVSVLGGLCACGVGALSASVNLVNNLRDIPTDGPAGKLTLAVALGDRKTRQLHAVLVNVIPYVLLVPMAFITPWVLLGLLAFPITNTANLPVRRGMTGTYLVAAIGSGSFALMTWTVLVGAGLVVSQTV